MSGKPVALCERMLELEALSSRIIGAAIEVHRALGPGLLEASYRAALGIEMAARGLSFIREVRVPMDYKGHAIGDYRIDFVVERQAVVEVKSVERHQPVFDAQLLAYLRATSLPLGLLINFNTHLLKTGIRRRVHSPGAEASPGVP